LVAVVADTSELLAATRAVTRTIVLTALLSVVAMVMVSQVVARRVTRPLSALVSFTREVAPGAAESRAPIGDDEVGQLGVAFNDMLDRLEHSQTALVQSEKLALAGLLAARVAHDIRNPLSSIKMQTQLLRVRTRGDGESQAIAAAVLADIDTVESVIRDLIELARPGELNRKPTQLNHVVLDLLLHLAPQLSHRKIGVETRLDETLPPIPLDADRFKQALLNVIVNAADAMPNGGALSLLSRRSPDQSTVELDVCDDGVGVDPAIIGRAFDPFVSTKRDGVGLGLVNTKAVIDSHGGRITLTPRVPRGTCATIWLPIGEAPHG
jgi:signal transduction histidine kinase